MTIAQDWARERNWNKARIIGAKQTLANMTRQLSILRVEVNELRRAKYALEKILISWDKRNELSKKNYLGA